MKKNQQNICIYTVVLLGICLLFPGGGTAQVDPYLPKPDLSYPRKIGQPSLVGDKMVANGVPSKIYEFKTNDSVERVAAYYSDLWNRKGYMVHQERYGDMTNVIAIVNPDKGTLQSILTYLDPKDKRTHVFSSSSIIDLSDKYSKTPSDLPRHPKSEVFSTFSSGAGQGNMHFITHKNSYSISFVRTYYKNAMRQKGWRLADEMDKIASADPDSFMFKKDARVCVLSFLKNTNGTGSFIIFNIMKK